MTEGYNRAKPTKPFKYRFKDLNEVFGKEDKDGKFGYASLTSNEYFLLLNRVATAYSTGRGHEQPVPDLLLPAVAVPPVAAYIR